MFDNGINNYYPGANRNEQQQPPRNNRNSQRNNTRQQQPQQRQRNPQPQPNGYQFSYPQYQNQGQNSYPNPMNPPPFQNRNTISYNMQGGGQIPNNFMEQLGFNFNNLFIQPRAQFQFQQHPQPRGRRHFTFGLNIPYHEE